jgi:hypothetical protein
VVFGTQLAIEQVLAACGWHINTAFVERLNLDIRQRVAAIGRRVNTLCQGEAGLRDQLALFHVYHNFVLPHTSLRQALAEPTPTNGRGSAKVWRPCTPAMAASLTDHVWSLKEVLFYRVPPWPQLQTVSSRIPVEDCGEERRRTLRHRPTGVNGGLKTSLACGPPADCHHSGGMRAVSKQYPQAAGTRPPYHDGDGLTG